MIIAGSSYPPGPAVRTPIPSIHTPTLGSIFIEQMRKPKPRFQSLVQETAAHASETGPLDSKAPVGALQAFSVWPPCVPPTIHRCSAGPCRAEATGSILPLSSVCQEVPSKSTVGCGAHGSQAFSSGGHLPSFSTLLLKTTRLQIDIAPTHHGSRRGGSLDPGFATLGASPVPLLSQACWLRALSGPPLAEHLAPLSPLAMGTLHPRPALASRVSRAPRVSGLPREHG